MYLFKIKMPLNVQTIVAKNCFCTNRSKPFTHIKNVSYPMPIIAHNSIEM